MPNYSPQHKRRLKRRLRRKIKTFTARLMLVFCIFGVVVIVRSLLNKDARETFIADDPEARGLVPEGENENENKNITEPGMVLSERHPDSVVQDIKNLLARYPEKSVENIAYHLDDYNIELLELVLRNPETRDFVAAAPDYIGTFSENKGRIFTLTNNEDRINPIGLYTPGEMPHFIQWDLLWGYAKYGNGNIAINGCGPTSLSMIMVYLTGDPKYTPLYLANYSQENGYITEYDATSWLLFSQGAEALGLRSREVPLSESAIINTLKDGNPIIVSMDAGDFTETGHIMVLSGVSADGKIQIHDPNSYEKTDQEWDIDIFMDQAKNLWTFSLR